MNAVSRLFVDKLKFLFRFRSLAVLPLLFACLPLHAGQIFTRQQNHSLTLPASPTSGAFTYVLTDPVRELSFDKPVAIRSVPGETNRMFVVERTGRIIVITNLAFATKTLFLDITDRVSSDYDRLKTEGLTSMALHPQYAQNGLFYLTYCAIVNNQNHNRLSEFKVSPENPHAALPSSERILISQPDEGFGHNFNDIHFGPDGFLYMSVGDEGDAGTGDDYNNAQKIDQDFFSGILRIDPIRRRGLALPTAHPAIVGEYSIPTNNPFLNATSFNNKPIDTSKLRAEFYAVGLRNPWRFSFDPLDGTLYEGDVGQHGKEEINIIVKGGNYGWSFKEGTLNGPKSPVPAGVTVIPPFHEYNHSPSGASVTGGIVYRGERFPDLYGEYIFADYVTGDIWALRNEGGVASAPRPLLKMGDVSGFAPDPRNGDVLVINHYGGRIWRLESRSTGGVSYPAKLSDTGAFSNLSTLTVHPGILPFDVNTPLWSDFASKRRWFSIPATNKTISFNADSNWAFPEGGVWIKHFELEMKKGDPSSSRRLETRFIVKTKTGVYGITYKWDADQQNATLVPDEGATETYTIQDGSTTRQQTWRFPSRSECLACHTAAGGWVLGFNTAQLNRDFSYPGNTTNQLWALSDAGYFTEPVTNHHTLRALASIDNEQVSRTFRVKSYLEANCSFCHRQGGTAQANWDARISTPLSESGIIGGSLVNTGSDPANRVIAPGDLAHSMLVQRMLATDNKRMPPIGSSVVDQEAVALLSAWVNQDLASYKTFAQWQSAHFQSTTSAEAAPTADPDSDGAPNKFEYLTGTDPKTKSDVWKIEAAPTREVKFKQLPHLAFVLEFTSSLDTPPAWQPWNDPANAPIFRATAADVTLRPPTQAENGYYRVKILEP